MHTPISENKKPKTITDQSSNIKQMPNAKRQTPYTELQVTKKPCKKIPIKPESCKTVQKHEIIGNIALKEKAVANLTPPHPTHTTTTTTQMLPNLQGMETPILFKQKKNKGNNENDQQDLSGKVESQHQLTKRNRRKETPRQKPLDRSAGMRRLLETPLSES